jgi:hypothetical protein
MESMEKKPREQIYDETIKNLEIKDCKALAGLAFPNIDEADDILLQFAELAMADMKRPDYIAKIRFGDQWFILHMEFESNYRSNREMQKRMFALLFLSLLE